MFSCFVSLPQYLQFGKHGEETRRNSRLYGRSGNLYSINGNNIILFDKVNKQIDTDFRCQLNQAFPKNRSMLCGVESGQVKSSQVKSSQVKSSQVKSSQVKSSQVKSSQGKARQGIARQGKARQGKARQGTARHGTARHGRAGQVRSGQVSSGQVKSSLARAPAPAPAPAPAGQGKSSQPQRPEASPRAGAEKNLKTVQLTRVPQKTPQQHLHGTFTCAFFPNRHYMMQRSHQPLVNGDGQKEIC